jgi:arsenate reductase (thioredoxin)
MQKLRVLFLCTGNSCRSQMAEGWARHMHPDAIEACSAGTAPTTLNPRAVQVMAEAGVDIGSQTSKHVDDLAGREFDYLITVCGHADEQCPVLAGAQRRLHVGFDDPPRLAQDAATEEEVLKPYRRVRDEIRDWIKALPADLERGA